MDYEKAMIPITIIILVGVLGTAGIATGQIGSLDLENFDKAFDNKQIIPEKSSDYKGDGYYQWCYKMNIPDC